MSVNGLTLSVAPTVEPVSVDEIKSQLRIIDDDADNTTLSFYIQSAREFFETQTNRQLCTATWIATYDFFPGRKVDEYRPPGWRYGIIRLPRSPLASVVSVQYIDTNGDTQTLASTEYQVSTKSEPGRVAPARFKVWPITDPMSMEAVTVTFTAGYGGASDVPVRFKQAIRFLVGHLYENREATVEQALTDLPLGFKSYLRASKIAEYN